LDIESSTAQLRIHSTTNNAVLRIESPNTKESKIYFGNDSQVDSGTIEYNHTSKYMSFDTDNSERMRITSTGAVGIGTSTPSATLHLSQTGNADILIERAAGAELRLRSQSNLGYIGTDSNHPLNLGTNAATRLGIKTNGQLQFNTYTGTTHDGTPVKILGVDASGNVVKTTRTYQTKSSLSFDSLGEATVTLPSTALYGVTATLESSAAEFIVIAQYLAGTSVKFKLYDHTGSAVASVTRTVHYTYTI